MKQRSEDVIHHCHECCRSIGQTHGHYYPFLASSWGPKGCLVDIFRLHSDLVIAIAQINLAEYFRSLKLVKEIMDPRERVLVLDGVLCSRLCSLGRT